MLRQKTDYILYSCSTGAYSRNCEGYYFDRRR